jgi:hypothetical protein
VFHLETHDANRMLIVQFDNTLISHVDLHKYLGMTLYRTLSYKPYLKNWNEGELLCQLSSKVVRHQLGCRSAYVTNSLYSASLICGLG